MTSSERPNSGSSTGRRLVIASILGIALFGGGYAVYQSGLISILYQAMGGRVSNPSPLAPYSRAEMEAARVANKKDSGAPLPRIPVGADNYFIPPSEDDIPKSAYGDAVRRGRDIFTRTGEHVKDHVGNVLACANCHLDAGRRENSAPMWAAYGAYPAFRAKTGAISTLEDRIQGCFMFSMNAQASPSGKAPDAGSDVYRDLITYMAWMANGAPAGQQLPGALYPKVPKPKGGYDLKRGSLVFQQSCALCHGPDGQGTRDASGVMKFPPLWGPDSYNWGAGMARIDTAAGFIKANMPLGQPYSLSDTEAWDVAAFVNSHERPKDARQTGTVQEAAEKYHAGEQSFYGKMLDGHLMGTGVSLSQ